MRASLKNKLTVSCILLWMIGSFPSRAESSSGTYWDTHRLLSGMRNCRSDSNKLARLFQVGDRRIKDLIRALNDPNPEISLRAQIVIRYLGNEAGMKALSEWYGGRREYPVAGPVPVPLMDQDYRYIQTSLIGKPPQTWRDPAGYIYALVFDGSARAKDALGKICEAGRELETHTFAGYAVRRVPSLTENLLIGKDLAGLVKNKAFFISPEDQKYVSTRLLGLTAAKDKALVEVYVNRGALAEEWYHVVIGKSGEDWKYLSVYPVAIS